MSASREASPDASPVGNLFNTPKPSPARPSGSNAVHEAGSASAVRPSASAARPSASAVRPSTASATAGRPPVRAPTTGASTPARASAARVTPRAGGASGVRPSARAGGSVVGVPTPRAYPGAAASLDLTGVPSDVQKQVKEVVARRDDAVFLRVLPKSQQLQQLILEESGKREVAVLQEQLARMQVAHKAAEEKLRSVELAAAAALKSNQEALKQQQVAELNALKESVATASKTTDADVKSKLAIVSLLQPRLGVPAKVLADIKDESSSCKMYAELLDEEKRLQRALKGDARYNNTKTAATDGGAVPYWYKQCVAGSFNVAAVVSGSPLRASVQDCASIASKSGADKKVVVVKNGERVVAWAQTRNGPDTGVLAEAYSAAPTKPSELPAAADKGLLWTKDQLADVTRKAKVAGCVFAEIVTSSKTVLEVDGVESVELMTKDVEKIGAAGSQ